MGKSKSKHNKEKEPRNTKKRKASNVNGKDTKKDMVKVKKKGANKKHKKLSIFFKVLLLVVIVLLIVGAGIFAGIFFSDKWQITESDLALKNINTTIYDKDGVQIATVSGDEKRKVIPLNEIPKNLQNAFIAIEDEKFETHHGINLKRTIGATVSYAFNGGTSSYGGSTITQQLVKNLMGDKADSGAEGIQRKIREISRAYQVEKILSKDQIMELYLNIIFMGGDVYGVELGSQYYFNKSAKDLDLAECAFLAGINNSPNAYNPYTDKDVTDKIKTRTKTVLSQMKKLGKITQEEYDEATSKVEAGFKFEKGTTVNSSTMSYLAKAALNQVVKEYASAKELDEDYASTIIYSGGFKIYSTQDTSIQGIMESEFLNKTYIMKGTDKDSNGNLLNDHTQAAMVIIDHKTGRVVATVGGLGETVDSNGLIRSTQTRRQPGSSIKPIASIAPALESGIITAATVYDDSPTAFGSYNPKNSGNSYQGLCTVRKAIEVSANVVEVKIMSELGPNNSISFLRKLGVTSLVTAKEAKANGKTANDENLSLVLGGITNGISPLEMGAAYAAIANDGVYITPTFYTKVEDSSGNVILEPTQEKTRVMSEGNAYIEKSILTGPVVGANGTAKPCAMSGFDVGAKTGTTNDNFDRWLCGFTTYYTGATWFGYDQNETIKSGYNNYARSIWAAVMKKVHAGLEGTKFEAPSNIVSASICLDSGMVATDSCSRKYTEYFVNGTVPDECSGHKKLTICTETGEIANEFCPNKEERTFLVKPQKEDTTLWKTNDTSKYNVPTQTCTVHSKTITKVKMVNVVNMTQKEATDKLKALGFTVVIETEVSTKKAGTVLSQSKKEGEELNSGASITLKVSKNEKTNTEVNNTVVANSTVETNTVTNSTP